MDFVADVIAWFTDAGNWSGGDGVPVRVFEHVWYSVLSSVIAIAVALPIGLWVGHTGRGGELAINIANFGRAIPALGVVVLAVVLAIQGYLPFSSLGPVPSILALVLLAIPPVLANAYVGVRQVDPEVVDAAKGMGMTGARVLRDVELPMAMPLVMAGIRTSTVQVVATATLAAFVGLGGLGRYIIDGQQQRNAEEVFAGGILVAVLALATEYGLAALQRLLVPEGLRLQAEAAGAAGAARAEDAEGGRVGEPEGAAV